MKGYSAIQCGMPISSSIISLSIQSETRIAYPNNPMTMKSITLTMLDDIPVGETAEILLYRQQDNEGIEPGTLLGATLDETCRAYDSIVFDLQDYSKAVLDCGDKFLVKTTAPATTAGVQAVLSYNYVLCESGEPVWNVGWTVDPNGNRVYGVKQKRDRVSAYSDQSVIRDATPYYTRSS